MRNREKLVFCRLNTCKGEQVQRMGEMKRALSAHEGREENQAFPSSCTGQGPSLGRQAEMAAQITCLVRRQQERSHRT